MGDMIGIFLVLILVSSILFISGCGQENKLDEVKKIAEDYHNTHTYSLDDFYVCSDMAMDVWNLIKTQGIDARICAGNINENSSHVINDTFGFETLNKTNHAWVLAEVEPFKYVAVETTGGYLVWGENATNNSEDVKNELYYSNAFCFDTPKQFKEFIDLRKSYIATCGEALQMENYWNQNIAGTTITAENLKYQGAMEAKSKDCLAIQNQLTAILQS